MMNLTIAEEASMPFAPITSKTISYAFALMVGLVGGVGSGFLREFFDDSVKTAADVTSSTALPVLASIPEENPRGKKHGGHHENILGPALQHTNCHVRALFRLRRKPVQAHP